jgi:hypothetical protein
VDALALRGDEGRGTLRYAARSCEQALIRGFPNGETHLRCQSLEFSRRRKFGCALISGLWHQMKE